MMWTRKKGYRSWRRRFALFPTIVYYDEKKIVRIWLEWYEYLPQDRTRRFGNYQYSVPLGMD